MDLNLLKTLKEMTTTAKEYQSVIEYFFDHFGEDPAFIALGERVDSAFLETVITQVGKELFGRKVAVGNVLLTRLPEQRFIHGGLYAQRPPGEPVLLRGDPHRPDGRAHIADRQRHQVRALRRPPAARQPDAVGELTSVPLLRYTLSVGQGRSHRLR